MDPIKRQLSGITAAALGSAACFWGTMSWAAPQPADTKGGASSAGTATRIVSFAPSNTELLYALGAGNRIIGVCNCCDYPAAAKGIPQVGTFSTANLERLARLKPDAVVCVSGQDALAASVKRLGFNVQLLNNNRLADVARNITSLGKMTNKTAEAAQLSQRFDSAVLQLREIVGKAQKKPRIFYCIWTNPLMTVGKDSFLDDVITACGAINIATISSATRSAYPTFSAERLVLADPDVVVLPYEAQKQQVLSRPPWKQLRAVRGKHIIYSPDPTHDGLARPTMRSIDGMYWLSSKLHPDLSAELAKWHADNVSALKN